MSGNSSSGSRRNAMAPIRAIAMKVMSVVTGLRSANRVWITSALLAGGDARRGPGVRLAEPLAVEQRVDDRYHEQREEARDRDAANHRDRHRLPDLRALADDDRHRQQ